MSLQGGDDRSDPEPKDDREELAEGDRGEGSRRYRAVSRLAVVSVLLGALSIVTVFSWHFAVFPIVGLILGGMAVQRIDAFPDELTGKGLAKVGMGLSLGMWALGGACLAFTQIREAPPDYVRVSFDDLQPDPAAPEEKIPPDMYELQGKRVYIKGFMYPGRQIVGIKQFILVPTQSHCSFCSRKLKSTEMVLVKLAGDLTTRYTTSWGGFGGKLEIDSAQASQPFGGLPYQIEADYVK